MRVMLTIVAALLALTGCGADGVPAPAEPPQAPSPAGELSSAEVEQATTLYAGQACAMCHGEQAEGGENGPALADLAPYWDVERLVAYLDDPDAFRAAHPDFDERRTTEYAMVMPAYAHLSADERQLLARWMLAR